MVGSGKGKNSTNVPRKRLFLCLLRFKVPVVNVWNIVVLSFIAIVSCNFPKLKIRILDRNLNFFPINVKVLLSTLTSQLIIVITHWLLALAAISIYILFLVLALFRTYLIHTNMYLGVPEIESAKVARWKTFLWLYKPEIIDIYR